MAKLELIGLGKHYGAMDAVRDLSLTVADGELVCLLGPSGCGKTTTLRMIGGFITPSAGDIHIDGTSVVALPPERRPTGMVFQRYTLWPHMDVGHNVAFGLELRRMPKADITRTVGAALTLVGLPGLEKRYPAALSGGQQQRVALARALVLEPRILLLDEPLSNLDAQLRVRMREEITAIQRRVGITTVFVTHDQEEALSIADRIAVMNAGVLEQLATPSELYAHPATRFVAEFIGTMNLIAGTVDGDTAIAGPFRVPLPEGTTLPDRTPVAIGIRPEDAHLLPANSIHGVPAQVTNIIDLGHYRKVTVLLPDGVRMTTFTTKGETVSTGSCMLSLDRVLLYADNRLVGEIASIMGKQPMLSSR